MFVCTSVYDFSTIDTLITNDTRISCLWIVNANMLITAILFSVLRYYEAYVFISN